jgi:hypothetical protein
MSHGGARPGAGRPRKALSDKVLAGNPGKRELTAVQFSEAGNSSLKSSFQDFKPPAYLDLPSKEGGPDIPNASEIYEQLAAWLDASECGRLISPHILEDFAFLRRGYLECEAANRRLGRVMQGGKRSPYTNLAMEYEKASRQIFHQIWLVVSQNSAAPVGGKNKFLELLKNRGF